MSEKRWASRALVNMLIREMKSYKSAAEVVSGSGNVFAGCARDIEEKVAAVKVVRSAVTGLALQQALDNAREEIAMHEAWQAEVMAELPKEDDESGATGPLRQAFAEAAKARRVLSELVEATSQSYFTS
jgi:hypothetical protein